jgi:hypothetical protein
MDWTLTGAVTGVAVLAGAVAYESFAFVSSGPEQTRETHTSAVLLPARERPPPSVIANSPVVAYAPPAQTVGTDISNSPNGLVPPLSPPRVNAITSPPPLVAYAPPAQTDGTNISSRPDRHVAALNPPRVETPAPAKRVDPTIPAPPVTKLNPPPADNGPPVHNDAKTQSNVSSDSWKVVRTAKANFFNLGGHVDNNGVVDSLASSYLRNALKQQKNFAKLPPQIKGYIDAPTINLAMIAGYRQLLGIDDRKMEDEQGVRFIRVATRSIEDTDLEDAAAAIDAPPLDLSPLERMASDLRREMAVSDPRR